MSDRSRFVELSHPIEEGMPVFPGIPAPRIGAHLTHEASRDKYEGAEFFLGKVDMPAGSTLNLPNDLDAARAAGHVVVQGADRPSAATGMYASTIFFSRASCRVCIILFPVIIRSQWA